MCERIDLGDGSFAIVCGGRHRSRRRNPEGYERANQAADKLEDTLRKKKRDRMISLPAPRTSLEGAGWKFGTARPCRLCGVALELWRAPDGKFHPLEIRAATFGWLDTHFRHCPHAEQFRNAAKAPRETKDARQGDLFK
jgi:hypothetical protein